MFKLDQCPKCGCQDLEYKSGTGNKIGFWEGYKCKNQSCREMTFNNAKNPKKSVPPQVDLKDMKQKIDAIYDAVCGKIGKSIPIVDSELSPDEDVPF